MQWVDSFLKTVDQESLTDDQHLLVSCYGIEFCDVGEDNSDLENVLAVHETTPSSAFLSPKSPSLSDLPDGLYPGTRYSLPSFLSFVWMALKAGEFSTEWKQHGM